MARVASRLATARDARSFRGRRTPLRDRAPGWGADHGPRPATLRAGPRRRRYPWDPDPNDGRAPAGRVRGETRARSAPSDRDRLPRWRAAVGAHDAAALAGDRRAHRRGALDPRKRPNV